MTVPDVIALLPDRLGAADLAKRHPSDQRNHLPLLPHRQQLKCRD
jgi:hypothetical protein